MVEVFKTDIYDAKRSMIIIGKLLECFPQNKINFDLEDSDKILRVEGNTIVPEKIIQMLREEGHVCEILD